MKKELLGSRPRANGSWVAAVFAALPLLVAHGANIPIKRPVNLANDSLHLMPLAQQTGEVELFLQFDEPAVAELNAATLRESGRMASSEAQKAQAARVRAQQERLRPLIESAGGHILSAHTVGANGFRVSIDASKIALLRSFPGVRTIGRVVQHTIDPPALNKSDGVGNSELMDGVGGTEQTPNNRDSVPWIGAPNVWTNLGIRGQGIRIGIIDTGIDYTHANFGGAGTPAAYASNNPNVIEPGTFPTAKVVGGYDFAGPTYTGSGTPQPDPDPLDVDGHGSHVAGTAAGIGVPGIIGAGVAPEAQLYALKVFGDTARSTNLTSLAIEWAMDPNGDGDMSDHLDVINMSLGAAFGDPNDPSAIAANNAAAVGIIVVASAGNEGPTPYVTGSPAVASQAISVAASIPGGRLYAKLTVTQPPAVAGVKPVVEGAGPVTLASTGPIDDDVVLGAPVHGCTPLTNAAQVAGNIALIARGSCTFLQKYLNAQAAGARAILVYNNSSAAPIVIGGLTSAVTIPGAMTTQAVGLQLAATAGVRARLEAAPDPTLDDRITNFSSQGPGQFDSAFKPDLSAPGQSITSTLVGSGNGPLTISGTSMAAPHTAGAAALLRQLHPSLDQSAIKALLQNASTTANPSYDDSLTRQGVGVIRVDRAAALKSFASPGGVSFGRINPVVPTFRVERVELTSLTAAWRTFSVEHVPNRTLPGVEVSCPAQVRVRGKHPAKLHLTLKFDPRASAEAGIADDGIVSQTEIDGWCVLRDGTDELRIGYIAVVDPASSVFVTPNPGLKSATVRNFGPTLGWAEAFTLAKIGGEALDKQFNAIAALGYRRADPALYGFNVLELGLATERTFTHLSNLLVDILIDTNADGAFDAELVGIDLAFLLPNVDPGTYVTAQFDATGAGFLDWVVQSWDFNDRAAILPFTFASDGGLVPEKFDYTMFVVNINDNSQDVQHGTIDMTKEIIPDLNSFGVGPKDKVEVHMSGGSGTSLWLFQNNPAIGQIGLSFTK